MASGDFNSDRSPGNSPNTIMLDDTPGSKPPAKVTVDIQPARYQQLTVLYTGVAVTNANPGTITVTYSTGERQMLDPWQICDWVAPQPDRCPVVLRGCDWWRSDRGFVTGDNRVCLYGQAFSVDPTRPIERVQFNVESMGTAGDVGVFALSGRVAGEPAEMQPIDVQEGFNFDTIVHHKDDDRSGGFRTEHKPQYFATEAASAAIESAPPRTTEIDVAPMADPAEIHRTSHPISSSSIPRVGSAVRGMTFVSGMNISWSRKPTTTICWLFGPAPPRASATAEVRTAGGHGRPPAWFDEKAAWQVPVIGPNGRIYVFSTHGGFSGGLSCRSSTDHGRSWAPPVELPFPKTDLDTGPAQWISCTVPHWDTQGRPLIAYTHWASSDAVPGGTVGITSRYSHIEAFRIENLDDCPAPDDLQFTWLNRDAPVTVPHETIEGASFAQEPYLVTLPDGRMMMTVRTNRGEAWYNGFR